MKFDTTIKKIFILLTSLLSLLNLTSCASIQGYTNCDVHSASQLPSLHPSEFGVTLLSTQQIVIKTKKDKFEFVSLLEIHPYKLNLVALTPVGQKLFQLQYQPQQLNFSGHGVPASFEPAFLLTDISLIYGKEKSLRQCFAQVKTPFSLKLSEDYAGKGMSRLLRVGGDDEITISYSGKEVWGSNIMFKNKSRHYSIEIKSLGVERL